MSTILQSLENLGYKVEWKVLNSKYFGVPQERKRIYIIGTDRKKPDMNFQVGKVKKIKEILESGLPTVNSKIVSLLLSHFSAEELQGKAIKDKRGGKDNIHSWDIELKGKVTNSQKELLNKLLTERRKKKWAYEYGIEWMDGMPLTKEHIKTFYDVKNLEEILEDLVNKGYLKKEYPKRKIAGKRVQDTNLPIGYNIVTGKMSFEINKILNPESIAPTLVAMDMRGLFVVDGKGLRNLSLREGLRLFGYPEDFKFEIEKSLGYDLLGNTVVVPAIEEVSKRVLKIYY